jgi:N-glycosylase/DNA lyase
MEKLIVKIGYLKGEEVEDVINKRMKEFLLVRESDDDIFGELCFCLLTANFQAAKSIKIQEEFGHLFESESEEELAKVLKSAGHRFWPQRAERIVLARKIKDELLKVVKSGDEFFIREWVVENVKGIGMKEASHFLRNIGFKNVAIVDFHIVDLLVSEGLVERPKSLNKKKYLEIEETLKGLGYKVQMSLAELDLYLWYIETGSVLK